MSLTASFHVNCCANTLLETVVNSRRWSADESWQIGSLSSDKQLPLNSRDTSSAATTAHKHLYVYISMYTKCYQFVAWALAYVNYLCFFNSRRAAQTSKNKQYSFSLNNEIQLKNNLFRLKLTFRPRRRPSSERSLKNLKKVVFQLNFIIKWVYRSTYEYIQRKKSIVSHLHSWLHTLYDNVTAGELQGLFWHCMIDIMLQNIIGDFCKTWHKLLWTGEQIN